MKGNISITIKKFFTNKNNLLKSIQGFEDQLDILKKAIKEVAPKGAYKC